MNRFPLTALLLLIVPILATACGGSGSGDGESAGTDPISRADIQAAESLSDDASELDSGGTRVSKRTKEGIGILLSGPAKLQVGKTATFAIQISNKSEDFQPEDPFSFRQETGQFITAGPIVLGELEGLVTEGESNLVPPRVTHGSGFDVTCTAAGKATITFHSQGQSGITSPESAYSITVDLHIECIDVPGYEELTNNALGFSQDSLNWVTFEQNGIVHRINQIEPVRLNVDDTVEIYSDFYAKDTLDDPDRELRDAKHDSLVTRPV